MSEQKHLTILGGGLCGLYSAHTALELGTDVTLLEKEPQFGGLAAGHQVDGNWFDLGVHMLHAFNQEVYESCAKMMGNERIEVPLKAHIKWGGKIYHYPLRGRDILAGIPPLTLARCLLGLVTAEFQSRFTQQEQGEDAESALVELYGAPLYEFFFEDFTERYWGMHPRELSAEFVRRKMPRLSAVDVFKNLLEKLRLTKTRNATEGALRFETLHYSETGSETLPRCLAESVLQRGAELHTSQPITKVTHDGCKIRSVHSNEKCYNGSHFLSSLPLPVLITSLEPAAPLEVINAAKSLRFKPMVVYGLCVKKERCMDALYTYYRDRIFHRVGEPQNAGQVVKQAGHTTLIVEMTCEEGDEKWSGEALDRVVKDLEAEGLCKASEIVSHHILQATHAYPIFEKGFDVSLKVVTDYLSRFKNLRSTGRQGGFSYPNMHSAMQMGADATVDVLS